MQCDLGHLLCKSCFEKLPTRSCPTCRQDMVEVRNLFAEQIIETLEFPCINIKYGCTTTTPINLKNIHEKSCYYSPVSCLYPDGVCGHKGAIPSIKNHLISAHKVNVINSAEVNYTIKKIHLKSPQDWIVIQSCERNDFIVSIKKTQNQGCCWLLEIAVKSLTERNNSMCAIELKNGNNKLKWEGTVLFLDDEEKNVFSIHEDAAKFYMTENNLKISVHINLELPPASPAPTEIFPFEGYVESPSSPSPPPLSQCFNPIIIDDDEDDYEDDHMN